MALALLADIRAAISAEAIAQELKPREFATTLLAVLLRRTSNEVRWFALHIGDGAIGADFGDGLSVLSGPENGEFGNTTYFVTGADAEARLRTYCGSAQDAAFALMTDGAAESLLHRGSRQLAPAVGSLFEWSRNEKPLTFANALSSNLENSIAPRTSDDVGLAIVTS